MTSKKSVPHAVIPTLKKQPWVWDGTLDNPQSGTLEVYKNNRIL
jgi:hypothetical protein